MEELNRIRNYTGKDEIVLLDKAMEYHKKQKNLPAFKTNIPTLDNLINGLNGGELTVLSGITKNGKSSFARTLALNFARNNIKSLYFPFEDSMHQFLNKFNAGLELECICMPKTLTNSAILWIKNKILEGILKHDIKVVFVDHLGFVSDAVQKQDRRTETDSLIRQFKTMAKELDVSIVVIHHIRKIDAGKIPSFEDLKDSSAIAQDSDRVLMIWREFIGPKGRDNYIEFTGDTILSVEVDRNMGVYKKQIKLIYKDNEFYERHNTNNSKQEDQFPI